MPLAAAQSLAIIGAGPIGLEAAVAALDHGFDAQVFEQGEVGSHPLAWGHVRMFTPWRMNVGPHARAHLQSADWTAPAAEDHPTGLELAEHYLEPLARLPELKDRVHAFAQVVQVGRRGFLEHEERGLEAARTQPFRLLLRDQGGRESFFHAFALIDASGVYANPRWAGTGGIPARSELYLRPQMACHLEDVLGVDRERYAGKRTLVIGGGTSAATAVIDLARLADETPGTSVAWATRSPRAALFADVANDPLPVRRLLCEQARALAAGTRSEVLHIGGAEVEGFEFNSATHRYRVTLMIGEQSYVEEADRIQILTGYGPDESLCRALRVDEPRYFVLGHKAYPIGSDFLLETGYRQVEEALARLAAETHASGGA